MTQYGYALLGLTAIVAALVSIVVFAFLKFAAAARDTRRHGRSEVAEPALLSAALQEAVTRLRAQERASLARAEASERLNTEIVAPPRKLGEFSCLPGPRISAAFLFC